jgi:hypothetical protein
MLTRVWIVFCISIGFATTADLFSELVDGNGVKVFSSDNGPEKARLLAILNSLKDLACPAAYNTIPLCWITSLQVHSLTTLNMC